MGFARARREIVTIPHLATDKIFCFFFFKKEGLSFRLYLHAAGYT
jgi:hypothetical protein